MLRQTDTPGFPPVVRERFAPLWEALPQLVVLAAFPGWGRTTWIAQCEAHLRTHAATMHIQHAFTRTQLVRLITPGDPIVVFADDLVAAADDELWGEIMRALREAPNVHLVMSTIDTPNTEVSLSPDVLVLDERDLAFTYDEIVQLQRQWVGIESPEIAAQLSTNLRGAPATVLAELRAQAAANASSLRTDWGYLTGAAVLQAFQRARSRTGVHTCTSANMWLVLDRAAELRWFNGRSLNTHLRDSELLDQLDADTIFARLRQQPFFTVVPDAHTGADTLIWDPMIWHDISGTLPPGERTLHLEHALASVQLGSSLVEQLFYQLLLDRPHEVERILINDYVGISMRLNPAVQDLVTSAPIDGRRTPALTVLRAEVDARVALDGYTPSPELAHAVATLRAATSATVESELGRFALVANAATFLGDRALAMRYLHHARELLTRLREKPGFSDVGAQLLLLVGVALEVDQLAIAVEFANEVLRHSRQDDREYETRRMLVESVQFIAGVYTPPSWLGGGVPVSANRMNRITAIESLRWPNYSRSAVDGFLLLMRAFEEPDALSGASILATVNRSATKWRGGVPSSLVAFAAMVAFLGHGLPEQAGKVNAAIAASDDLFAKFARVLWAQNTGDFAVALSEVRAEDVAGLPRFEVLDRVLKAASLLNRNEGDRAVFQLGTAWGACESPGLFKFALRLVPGEIVRSMAQLAPNLPAGLREVFKNTENDARHLQWNRAQKLSRTEHEVVELLALGLKNQEIAERRHVTVGTIRTQLKSIYRKLGASNRTEALALVQRRGV